MSITWTIRTNTKRVDRETQVRRWVQAESEQRRERARLLGTAGPERPYIRVSL